MQRFTSALDRYACAMRIDDGKVLYSDYYLSSAIRCQEKHVLFGIPKHVESLHK